MTGADLLPKLYQGSKVAVRSVLNEAVEEEHHLVSFEHVVDHDLDKLIHAILQEVNFRLQRIIIQKLIGNLGQCLRHELESVPGLRDLRVVDRATDAHKWVDLLERHGEEMDQVTEVEHVSGKHVH